MFLAHCNTGGTGLDGPIGRNWSAYIFSNAKSKCTFGAQDLDRFNTNQQSTIHNQQRQDQGDRREERKDIVSF